MMDYSVLSGIYGTGVTLLQIIGEKWGGDPRIKSLKVWK